MYPLTCSKQGSFENVFKAALYANSKEGRKHAATTLERMQSCVDCDERESEMLRLEGNVLFMENNSLENAALMYTRAICKAPVGTSVLALAHGNRAAALYKLGEMTAAYHDCECALKFKHPNTKKMESRLAVIGEAVKNTLKSKGNDNKEKLPKIHRGSVLKSKRGLRLQSCERGRYCVADEDIEKGEVIMSEECFAFTTCSDKICFICDNCLEDSIVPFPCYTCRAVFYCSAKCLEEHAFIHNIECNGYQVDLFRDMNELHLALRCLLVSFESLLSKLASLKGDSGWVTAEQLWKVILSMAEEGEIMALYGNFQHYQEKRNILAITANASLLACYLASETDLFERTRLARTDLMSSDVEWQTLVTALLLHLSCALSYNQYMQDYLVSKEHFAGAKIGVCKLAASLKVKYLSKAVFLRTSMFNHACTANSFYWFKKRKIYVMAKKDIAKDEEIVVSYLANDVRGKKDRTKFYQDCYAFTCKCNACQNVDDPEYVNLNGVICNGEQCGATYVPHDRHTCPACGTLYNPAFYQRIIINAKEMFNSIDKFHFLCDDLEMMARFFPKEANLFRTSAYQILKSFICASIDENVHSNEVINRRMLHIAADLLQKTEVETSIFSRTSCKIVIILLDLLALHKKQGFANVSIFYEPWKMRMSFQIISTTFKYRLEKYLELIMDDDQKTVHTSNDLRMFQKV